MKSTNSPPSRFWATYLLPAVLGVVSGGGLIFALVGDGLWDIASWGSVGLPLVVGAWHLWRSPINVKS